MAKAKKTSTKKGSEVAKKVVKKTVKKTAKKTTKKATTKASDGSAESAKFNTEFKSAREIADRLKAYGMVGSILRGESRNQVRQKYHVSPNKLNDILLRSEVVDDVIHALRRDPCSEPAVVVEDVAINQRFMLIVVAPNGCWQGMGLVVVDVVVANDVPRPRAGYVDGVSVGEQLHRMRYLVVFKEIVPGMIVLLASFPALVSTAPPVFVLGRNLMPANRSAALPIQTPIRFHTRGDEHRRIAAMVQFVVDHSVVATLPGP